MNGRSILFNRCLIGFLAYFLCGLALADFDAKIVDSGGIIKTQSEAKNCAWHGQQTKLEPVGGASVLCMEFNPAPSNSWSQRMTMRAVCNFPGSPDPTATLVGLICKTKIKCDSKSNQSAGDFYIPIPGSYMNAAHEAVLTNKESVVGFARAGFPSCDGTCRMVRDKRVPSSSDNYYRDDSTAVLVLISMVYNGEECSATEKDSKSPPKLFTGAPSKPPEKNPAGPSDCPPRTTYGEVNGVKMCAKNAPLPTDPSPPPKPGDKDACVGNCDKWDPNKDGKDPKDPTDPNKPKDPTTPGGSTSAPKGPLGSDASKPASENASGPGDSSLAASCTDFKCKNKDPATCEIARLAWNNKCIEEKALKDLTDSELYKSGNKSMSSEGVDDMKLKLNFNGEGTLDMTDTIKQDRFLSGGGLADVSFSVMGKSFALPFSKLNKYLSMCGDIAVAFSLIAAARILSSAV